MSREKLSEEEKRLRNRERQRRWREAHPEKVKVYNQRHGRLKSKSRAQADSKRWYEKNRLRVTYGITNEERDALLAAQGFCCAICGRDRPNGRHGKWNVDHCHDTGKVRGLLCHSCNVAIGLLQDSPKALRSAAEYIEKHQ